MPHFDLPQLVQTAGYIGLFAIVFAESGLFFGFFLPGDSLLFTAGFLASTGILNIYLMIPLLIVAAIAGDSVGYWTGRHFGKWLRKQKESFFFKKHHLEMAEKFYEKNGSKTIVLARFMPFVRTFAPIVAGMSKMNYGTFISYNVIGGTFWVSSISLAGFILGSLIPGVDQYLYPIIGVIIILSILPAILHWYKEKTSYKHMHPKAGPTKTRLHDFLSRFKSK